MFRSFVLFAFSILLYIYVCMYIMMNTHIYVHCTEHCMNKIDKIMSFTLRLIHYYYYSLLLRRNATLTCRRGPVISPPLYSHFRSLSKLFSCCLFLPRVQAISQCVFIYIKGFVLILFKETKEIGTIAMLRNIMHKVRESYFFIKWADSW